MADCPWFWCTLSLYSKWYVFATPLSMDVVHYIGGKIEKLIILPTRNMCHLHELTCTTATLQSPRGTLRGNNRGKHKQQNSDQIIHTLARPFAQGLSRQCLCNDPDCPRRLDLVYERLFLAADQDMINLFTLCLDPPGEHEPPLEPGGHKTLNCAPNHDWYMCSSSCWTSTSQFRSCVARTGNKTLNRRRGSCVATWENMGKTVNPWMSMESTLRASCTPTLTPSSCKYCILLAATY